MAEDGSSSYRVGLDGGRFREERLLTMEGDGAEEIQTQCARIWEPPHPRTAALGARNGAAVPRVEERTERPRMEETWAACGGDGDRCRAALWEVDGASPCLAHRCRTWTERERYIYDMSGVGSHFCYSQLPVDDSTKNCPAHVWHAWAFNRVECMF